MKASETKLLPFLKKSPQFAIPIYQRTYSWTESECQTLWDDILRAGRDNRVAAHFIGSIVYIEEGLFQVTTQSSLLVIDGQQRLTTLSLLLEALARHVSDAEPVDGFSARKLRNYYLVNPEETNERHFKLLLTQTDKSTLIALVDQGPLPREPSLRIVTNFSFFERQLTDHVENLEALCLGLDKLVIVDVSLNREHDNPQLIFESMNSTGRELTQADLIRNFVLMGLEPDHQNRLYRDHWRPMEVEFGQEAYGEHFDHFMRHYLTVRTGDIPNVYQVYDAFKKFARDPRIAGRGVDVLVGDIHRLAGYYCAMALGAETDKGLGESFQDLRELRVDVAYPLLLELYEDYKNQRLDRPDFLHAIRLVESYVFRRAVCSMPTNSLNRTFATLVRTLRKDRYIESMQAQFLLMPSYRRFPDDQEFERELKLRDLYNFPRRTYWLRRLENYGRKERVPVDEYTIEHIMPQNENLSPAWRAALGSNWERIRQAYLHTIGNLTLTGYNSEYSDRPFPEKRDMEGGFRHSPLNLNQSLHTLSTWNEDTILQRADNLAKLAVRVWTAPKLATAVLNGYRADATKTEGYALDDYPHLASGVIRALFEELRREVLALDPCVTEHVLKVYIAYKAETNFVDVVPQAARLRLSLNMPFYEVVDPKGVCKDTTNLGRWGNGDVEVGLSSSTELPYVMGLIRQALERQMADRSNAS